MPNHSRRKKPVPMPDGRSEYVHGVGFHKASGRYRIQHRQGVKIESEYFPKTHRGLAQAKRRRAEIDGKPTPMIPAPLEEAEDRLLSLGIDPEALEADPEIAERERGRRINPAWWKSIPDADKPNALASEVFEKDSDVFDRLRTVGRSDNPQGKRLTVAQVGDIYRSWYVNERCDVEDAERKASVANASGKRKKNRKGYTWLDFVKPSIRSYHNEHQRYYATFVQFVGTKTFVDALTGNMLRDFYDHIQQTAKQKACRREKPISNPDIWANKRYGAVTSAMRRAKRRFPEAAWARGLFGDDGLLKILETKGTTAEGQHTHITRAEFKKMLGVADTQWRALLMLAINALLKNSDMLIPWTAIDWKNKLMRYPRPKNKRKRITPLAKETIEALKRWREESSSSRDEIFVTWYGTPWVDTTDSIGKHWNILRDKVEKQTGHRIPATFNSLRKTPGPLILAAQVPNAREAIQYLLGHQPNESWRHYVDVAPESLYASVEVIRREFFTE